MRVYPGPVEKSQIQRSIRPKLSQHRPCRRALGRDGPPRGRHLLWAPGICPTGAQGARTATKFAAEPPARARPRSGQKGSGQPSLRRWACGPGCDARSAPTPRTREPSAPCSWSARNHYPPPPADAAGGPAPCSNLEGPNAELCRPRRIP